MKFLKVTLFLLVTSAAMQTFAQTEAYDMMIFTPPKGWERKEFEDRITLLKTDRSCAIAIFRSRESSGSGETDFKNEWQAQVAKQFNTNAESKMQDALKAEGGDGEMLMGGASIEANGQKLSVMLTVFRGYGRVMSVLTLNPGSCQEEIMEFLPKVELSSTRRPR